MRPVEPTAKIDGRHRQHFLAHSVDDPINGSQQDCCRFFAINAAAAAGAVLALRLPMLQEVLADALELRDRVLGPVMHQSVPLWVLDAARYDS